MSLNMTLESAFQYWEQLDCPTSLACAILARAGQWTEVLTYKVEPEHFADPFHYAKANAAVTYLKKNPFIPGSTDKERKAAALAKWKDGEASCYRTNERLAFHLVSPLSGDAPSEFLRRVRRRLLSWLRNPPSDEEIQNRARHGPGTTFSSAAVNPTAADKYDEVLSLTTGAVWHLANIVGTYWGTLTSARYTPTSFKSSAVTLPGGRTVSVAYEQPSPSLDACVNFQRGNRWVSVPKTALTDRSIGIECSLNVYIQLAIGASLRSRLKRATGWDLNAAADIHRKVACQASVDGSFATIDLANASDTLCKNLVRILLRDTAWLELMEDVRSSHTQVDGKWHLLEKFSSMGNGYTFELESCVFAAICAECLLLRGIEPILGHNLYVFGDDIIVPTETAGLVVDVLRWVGFEINKEKSFVTGPFRESCGGDYFLGNPVRGFYLKSNLSNADSSTLFTAHNGGRTSLQNCQVDPGSYMDWVQSHLPPHLRRIGGSPRLGDTVLHGRDAGFRWRHGVRWVRAVKWKRPKTIPWSYFSPLSRLACRLTGHGHTFGIDSRGAKVVSEVVWVSDS